MHIYAFGASKGEDKRNMTSYVCRNNVQKPSSTFGITRIPSQSYPTTVLVIISNTTNFNMYLNSFVLRDETTPTNQNKCDVWEVMLRCFLTELNVYKDWENLKKKRYISILWKLVKE